MRNTLMPIPQAQLHPFSNSIMRFKYILFFLFPALSLTAQQELMLHNLPDVWHSNSTNPAFFPKDKRIVIGLPGYALHAAHSGDITYRDVFIKTGDRTEINFSNAIDRLDPENEVFFDQRIETGSIGLRLPGKLFLTVGHANRFTGTVTYPKDLPALIWNGNGPYVGKTLDIGPQAKLFDWNEWSAGLSKAIGSLTIGAKLKYLTGISALRTDENRHTAQVYTDPDIYQLSLTTDYAFHSSSLISAFDTSGLGFDLVLGKVKNKLFSANRGIAFDFGADWQLTERLRVSASILDFGGTIKWTENANYFASRGTYQYDGVTFPGTDIINGADSLSFDTKLDTLNDIFKFNKTPESFTTQLPARYYASAAFKLTEKWGIGASLFMQTGTKKHSAFGVSARWSPMRWLSLGALYSVNERSATNLGFHIVLKPGPLQLYFMSDNLANAFSVKHSAAVNLQAGAALLF